MNLFRSVLTCHLLQEASYNATEALAHIVVDCRATVIFLPCSRKAGA